jgi:hypothetical protein
MEQGKSQGVGALRQEADPYEIFDCSADDHARRDPTLSYCHGHEDGEAGRPIRGSSSEYEDGYLAGRAAKEQPQ